MMYIELRFNLFVKRLTFNISRIAGQGLRQRQMFYIPFVVEIETMNDWKTNCAENRLSTISLGKELFLGWRGWRTVSKQPINCLVNDKKKKNCIMRRRRYRLQNIIHHVSCFTNELFWFYEKQNKKNRRSIVCLIC